MNYIIYDLEFNQATKDKSSKNADCPFEILQIGAVKLDENLKIISNFSRLIKPQIYLEINPFISEMTGITMSQLDNAKPFQEIYTEFMDFLRSERSILCVWGMADIKELIRNIEYYKLDSSLIPKEYINIQSYTSKYFNFPTGVNVGLSTSVELLNIPVGNSFHDAYNDAYYTSEVFKKIYSKNIKIKTYELDKQKKSNRNQNAKAKIDTYKLFKQFEKMFNREMSAEERKIIKIAYMMGKTNQFQVETTDNVTKTKY